MTADTDDKLLEMILGEMREASDKIDAAAGTSNEPKAMTELALLARHYLRTREGRQQTAKADAVHRGLYGADRLRLSCIQHRRALFTAREALLSYQYGNAAPDLAREVAEAIDRRLNQPDEGPYV
jgi:hypothetical protein